jgi:hypothetical protein
VISTEIVEPTEAHAEIDGGPEKYVKSGSTLKLTCHLRQSSVTPDFVFWYQDERMINYEGAAGVKVISDAASSTLIIERAQSVHSGNYSCVPYNVNPSSVIVHILNGKKEKIPSRHRLSQPTLVRKVFLHVVHCTRLLSSSLSLSTAVATPISRVLRLIFIPDSRIVPRSFLVFFLLQLLDLRSLLSLGFLPSFPLFFFFFSTYYITPTARAP